MAPDLIFDRFWSDFGTLLGASLGSLLQLWGPLACYERAWTSKIEVFLICLVAVHFLDDFR